MSNHAIVSAFSADPEDLRLTLKVECLTCGIEWGWRYDELGAYERLKIMADAHETQVHGAHLEAEA